MNDDELDRGLRAWAEATDPASDPVSGAEVRAEAANTAAVVPVTARRRLLPWVGVAAALVLVVGGVVAWSVTDGDDETRVATGPTPGQTEVAAVPVQIVVEALGIGAGFAGSQGRVVVEDGSGAQVLAAPLAAGTTLVLDQDLPQGPLGVTVELHPCAAPQGCGATTQDGRPEPAADMPSATLCEVELAAVTEPTLFMVDVDARPQIGAPTCDRRADGLAPALTVPPAWSVREELPWECGIADLNHGSLVGPDDPGAARAARQCFLERFASGEPTELPSSEIQPADDVRRAWWRIGGADQDSPLEIIRSAPLGGSLVGEGEWSIQRCQSLAPSPDEYEVMEAVDCAEEEPLSLDLPPLPEAAATPSPTTTVSGSGEPGLRLVIDTADLPLMGREGGFRRWVLNRAGEEAAGGPITSGPEPQTALVIDGDVPRVANADADLSIEGFVCSGSCPAVNPDGTPVEGSAVGDAPKIPGCTTPVPPFDTDEVVVLRLRGTECTVEVVAAVPPLTVPPAWSLRPPFEPTCGVDTQGGLPEPLYEGAPSPSRAPRECLARALAADKSVELASAEAVDGGTRQLTYRVSPGRVELFRPADPAPSPAEEPWTLQVCTGLNTPGDPPWIVPTGCGPEEPLSLDPP